MQVSAGLGVNQDLVGFHLGEGGKQVLWLLNHQVDVERHVGVGPYGIDHHFSK